MSGGSIFLWIAIILVLTRLSALIERIGQPAVMGELFVGIALGNLTVLGVQVAEPIKHDLVFKFLAELGVVILLFQVGLESKIEEMRRLGFRVLIVACVGVVIPFFLGYSVVAPYFFPNSETGTRLFLGAMLTATSVGISAKVFQDIGRVKSAESQMVMGAAVIDDILGLSILAVIKAIVESGRLHLQGIAWISFKAVAFLCGAVLLGQILTQWLGKCVSRINPGIGMKFILAIGFCLIFASAADFFGLAPIVGAFAAGLILEPIHFVHFDDPDIVRDVEKAIRDSHSEVKEKVIQLLETHADIHVQTLIKPLAHFLVPLFFVRMGMEVKLTIFLNPDILVLALGLTIAAFIGKIIAGMFAGPVKKAVVGWGLVPRGEVTLIFAATGRTLGVLSDSLFSATVIMVLISTLIAPPVLTFLLKPHPITDLP